MPNAWSPWIYEQYIARNLQDHQWIAVTDNRLIVSSESLDVVIGVVDANYLIDNVNFAYITYDICQ
jgi:hypothetical protein